MTNTRPQRVRVGLTRGEHRYEILHPGARDSHAEGKANGTQDAQQSPPLKRAPSQTDAEVFAPPKSPSSSSGSESRIGDSELDGVQSPKRRRKIKNAIWVKPPSGKNIDPTKEEDTVSAYATVNKRKNKNKNMYSNSNGLSNNVHASGLVQKKATKEAQNPGKKGTSKEDDYGFIDPHKVLSLPTAKKPMDADPNDGNFDYLKDLTKRNNAFKRETSPKFKKYSRVSGDVVAEPHDLKPIVSSSRRSSEDGSLLNNAGKTKRNLKRVTASAVEMNDNKLRRTPRKRIKSKSPLDLGPSFQTPIVSAIAKRELGEPTIQDTREHSRMDIIDLESGSSTPLSSVLSISTPSEHSLSDRAEPPSSNTSITTLAEDAITECPICNTRVSAEQVAAFRSRLYIAESHRLNVRQQASFHRDHISYSAKVTWQERHYPSILWSTIPTRLDTHKSHIVSIIRNDTPSHYRSALHSAAPGDSHKTRIWADELARGHDGAEGVGYYGSRGQKAFGLWAVEKFSGRLRDRQNHDPDIAAAGGVSAFVQKVLVPEIAQTLIREDLEQCPEMSEGVRDRAMERAHGQERQAKEKGQEFTVDWSAFAKVGQEETEYIVRWIAEESAECGRLLSEEEDDVVDPVSEEEDVLAV